MDRRGASVLNTSIESISAHLDRGAPWDACDAFREAISTRPDDPELLYWGALAHARAGATLTAHALLDRAQAGVVTGNQQLSEILSLRGRLWKDVVHRGAGSEVIEAARRAREHYLQAHAIALDPYPGVNAATLSRLMGERDASARLAGEVKARLATQAMPRTAWDFATEGEALALLDDLVGAARCYAAAFEAAAGNTGTVATMRRQIELLARAVPQAAELLDRVPVNAVVAFAGHMVDTPQRTTRRFPAALVPAVRAALCERLATMRAPIVFTSAACGADLLFIEAAFEQGAEVNIVLPFDRTEFVRTSVAVGGNAWVSRFDAALARAHRVVMATEEAYLDDDVLFEHAALLVEGFAMLRAGHLQTLPSLLCVVDTDGGGAVGGTHATLARWQRNVGAADVIDLRALRRHAGLDAHAANVNEVAVAAGPRPDEARAAPRPSRPRRTLKSMLFADFAGYSRLHDALAPLFQREFLQVGAAAINAASSKPLEAKTWGDALYAVFDGPHDAADFALSFLARMLAVDWTRAGLDSASQVRVALHAGPVFRAFDPVMQRDGFFGSSVTRAARIEPVTPPGMVYASEAFAATLASTGQPDYALEYVGTLPLAKGYGESRIYRLDRCHSR
ncbi:MAG TPA: adenylate/guanylate cyclase domain-containing protein [Casimicrobiaceae bacterium]|nr:adenylate/guanylate cyclase domain-containing protein [Casimicrobiaceae bacterium]